MWSGKFELTNARGDTAESSKYLDSRAPAPPTKADATKIDYGAVVTENNQRHAVLAKVDDVEVHASDVSSFPKRTIASEVHKSQTQVVIVVTGTALVTLYKDEDNDGGDEMQTQAQSASVVSIANRQPRDLVSLLVNDARFTVLVAAVKAAGILPQIQAGGITVFAPTNDAFAKLKLNESNIASQPQLVQILVNHVAKGRISAESLVGKSSLKMLNNNTLPIRKRDGKLSAIGSANIQSSTRATNGLVYVIDSVLVPPQATNVRFSTNLIGEMFGEESALEYVVEKDEMIIIPAGMAHEIAQVGESPLKVASLYCKASSMSN